MIRAHRPPIVHPRMMREIGRTHMAQSFCTIGEPKETQDSFGQIKIVFSPYEQLTAIPCYIEPLTANTEETRKPEEVVVTGWFQVMLQRYCPSIQTTDQATINDVIYNVRSVYHDDTRTITMLNVEIVNDEQIPA